MVNWYLLSSVRNIWYGLLKKCSPIWLLSAIRKWWNFSVSLTQICIYVWKFASIQNMLPWMLEFDFCFAAIMKWWNFFCGPFSNRHMCENLLQSNKCSPPSYDRRWIRNIRLKLTIEYKLAIIAREFHRYIIFVELHNILLTVQHLVLLKTQNNMRFRKIQVSTEL